MAFPLRMKWPAPVDQGSSDDKETPFDNLPFIGKFDERVNLEQAVKPVLMFQHEEDIIEEVEDPTVEKVEERRRQKRMKRFRPRSVIYLEDSARRRKGGPPTGLQYEGTMTNLNLADSTEHHHVATARAAIRSTTEAPFKYVLLQVVGTPAGGKEVNVVPVAGKTYFNL